MCHLSIEKALKGLYVKKFEKDPPKIHNLIYLVEKIGIQIPDDFYDFVFVLNRVSVPTRYPDNLKRILREFDKDMTKEIFVKSKEVLECLKKVIEAIKFLESSLTDAGLNISKIILFGSQAKRNQTKESDVDLIIISDDFKDKNIFERANITKDAEIGAIKKFLIPFDIITLTTEEFENSLFSECTVKEKIIYDV